MIYYLTVKYIFKKIFSVNIIVDDNVLYRHFSSVSKAVQNVKLHINICSNKVACCLIKKLFKKINIIFQIA